MWFKLPWLGGTREPDEPGAALGAPSQCHTALPVLKLLKLAFRLKELRVRHK